MNVAIRKQSREARRAQIRALANQGLTFRQLAERLGFSELTLRNDAKAIGLSESFKAYGRSKHIGEGIDAKKARRQEEARQKVQKIRDRRRFKTGPVPTGIPARVVGPDVHNTQFPTKVLRWSPALGETILKDGANSQKIGGDVLVGRLKGAKIYTLTLEERATCPKTCPVYRACYGNAMPHSRRWRHGPEFEKNLEAEVRQLCQDGAPILIRLHILGDFYSMRYLALWVALLDDYPNLNVFGFTAHPPKSKIGAGVARVREALGDRFSIRHSGTSGCYGAFTIDFPTNQKFIGEALVCPEQRHAADGTRTETHCGNCAACWQTDRAIAFVLH